MPVLIDTDKFIQKAKEIHNNIYDYSLTIYINQKTKIKIICSEHGIFHQTPNNHIYSKQGCPSCGGSKKLTVSLFIEKADKIHNNKYDYSLVDYKDNKSKIKIICPEHGVFEQHVGNHIYKKYGCPKCKAEKMKLNNRITTQEFIIKSKIVHAGKYDYSLSNYNGSKNMINIICPKHGIFEQQAGNHMYGRGCSSCKSSKGEIFITDFLNNNGILFEKQKRFKDCRNKLPLPFDFYLPSRNMCIEYDGKQHFEEAFGNDSSVLKYIQANDAIKNEYCKDNNMNLLRIRYDENIYDKLNFGVLI